MRQSFSAAELSDLANAPGYGVVEQIVRSRGFWDDSLDPNFHPFEILAIAEEWDEDEDQEYADPTDGWAEIWARDLEHATEKADKLTIKDFEWNLQTKHGRAVELLDDLEIVEIKTMNPIDRETELH